MYILKPMVIKKKLGGGWGHPESVFLCVCKFLKMYMFSDKTVHKAFRIHKT